MPQMREMLRGTMTATVRDRRSLWSLAAAGAFTVSLGLAGCQTQDPYQVEHDEFDERPPVQQPQQQPAPAPQQEPAPAPGEYR